MGYLLVLDPGRPSRWGGDVSREIYSNLRHPEVDGALGGPPHRIHLSIRKDRPLSYRPWSPTSSWMGFLVVNGGPGGETRGVATALLPGPAHRHFFLAADEKKKGGAGP